MNQTQASPNSFAAIAQIALTLCAAVALSIAALPGAVVFARPDFVALTLIFWCWRRPDLVGLGVAFAVGLLVDAMSFDWLGQNALSNLAIIYLAILSAGKNHEMSIARQCWTVGALLLIDAALEGVFDYLAHGSIFILANMSAALTGAAIWAAFAYFRRR